MFQRAFSDLDILFCYLVLPKPTLLCVHCQQPPAVIYSFRCVLKYEGKVIEHVEVGIEYEELLTHFTGRFISFPRSASYFISVFSADEERVYAYVRFETGDEMSRRAKFAFITWIGPSVSPLKKAKVSTDKAFVKKLWPVS